MLLNINSLGYKMQGLAHFRMTNQLHCVCNWALRCLKQLMFDSQSLVGSTMFSMNVKNRFARGLLKSNFILSFWRVGSTSKCQSCAHLVLKRTQCRHWGLASWWYKGRELWHEWGLQSRASIEREISLPAVLSASLMAASTSSGCLKSRALHKCKFYLGIKRLMALCMLCTKHMPIAWLLNPIWLEILGFMASDK